MKRLVMLTVGLIAGSLLTVSGSGLASESPDRATGGVTALAQPFSLGVTVHVSFTAHGSTPVKGHVTYKNSLGEFFRGRVDICYAQIGNVAVFAGTMDEFEGTFAGSFFKIQVHDNGEGPDAPPDLIRAGGFAAQPVCTPDSDFLNPVTDGNLQVHG